MKIDSLIRLLAGSVTLIGVALIAAGFQVRP